MVTPRYLHAFFSGKAEFREQLFADRLVLLFRFFFSIVFDTFTTNLFDFKQLLTFSTFSLLSAHGSPIEVRFVSSAKTIAAKCLQTRGMLFTYIINSRGPKIKPCGTLQTISSQPDESFFNLTRCFWPFNFDLNQSRE